MNISYETLLDKAKTVASFEEILNSILLHTLLDEIAVNGERHACEIANTTTSKTQKQ